MTVSDNTILAEIISDLFKNLGKKGLKVSKILSKNVLNNPTRALDIIANIATAVAFRNPKDALKSLLELIILIILFKVHISDDFRFVGSYLCSILYHGSGAKNTKTLPI